LDEGQKGLKKIEAGTKQNIAFGTIQKDLPEERKKRVYKKRNAKNPGKCEDTSFLNDLSKSSRKKS